MKFSSAEEAKAIPEGAVSVADKRIEITPAPKAAARTVPITDSGHVDAVADAKNVQVANHLRLGGALMVAAEQCSS